METIDQFREKCNKAIEHFTSELAKIRSGRANTSLLESVMVDYYGAKTPLQQLGLISAPEARMLTVQVYDASAIDAVEKAIQQADLGLNPARDGNLVRIPIPALTEDRRKDMVKMLGKVAEEQKIAIRNHRREANDQIKKLKDVNEATEDDVKKYQDDVQGQTDSFISNIDDLMKQKETEILSV